MPHIIGYIMHCDTSSQCQSAAVSEIAKIYEKKKKKKKFYFAEQLKITKRSTIKYVRWP